MSQINNSFWALELHSPVLLNLGNQKSTAPPILRIYILAHYAHVHAHWLSPVQLFGTPWTVAHQSPLSTEFPRQEHRSGLPFPSPGEPPYPGIKLASPALAVEFFTTEPSGKPSDKLYFQQNLAETFNLMPSYSSPTQKQAVAHFAWATWWHVFFP